MAVKMFTIGLEWVYVVASRVALVAVRVCGVMAPYVSKSCFMADVGDWTFEEAGVVIDEVGEAVWIDSSVDLLDDCAFDEVTHLERLHEFGVDFLGYRNLVGS